MSGDYYQTPMPRKIVVGDPLEGFSLQLNQRQGGGTISLIMKDENYLHVHGKLRILVFVTINETQKIWKEYIDVPMSFEYSTYEANK